MTHDELIAAGIWSGNMLEFRSRMAEYIVDGSRFGEMCLKTKSGSENDTHLDKRTSEISTACMLFAYLGYERIEIVSLGPDGKALERPDLDVRLPDGSLIGLEVADVSETDQRKHESGRNLVEVKINDLLGNDPLFKEAMGKVYFAVTLNGVGPYGRREIGSKKEAQAIAAEIEAFVRSGQHLQPTDDYFETFSAAYSTLHGRGAQYHVERWEHEANLSIGEGASTIGPAHRRDEVIRVLDDHRASAKKAYRNLPTWIVLLLTDTLEYFYNTITAVENAKPPIDPFVRGYLMDAAARVLLVEP
jgi:hypothetical protein